MNLDVVYLAWNRKEFTEFTFNMLLENTEWDRVRQLMVYDDGSTDGTVELLYEKIHRCPVEYHIVETGGGWGPVGIMNHYVESSDSDLFAKIDNDIVVPPGWLGDLADTLERYPTYEVLGMEAGRMEHPRCEVKSYSLEPARWIGGVGLLRTSTLGRRPLMVPNGRYGWTEHQQSYNIAAGWIKPDLLLCSLDQVPLEPWVSLAEKYVEEGWARPWGKYHERWMSHYWSWWEEKP